MAAINDYLPFKIDSNQNPTGYDSTTGLYTHPNGQSWLRSGFTLQGVTATYPNATTTTTSFTGGLQTSWTATGDAIMGMQWDSSTNRLLVADRNSNTVKAYQSDGTFDSIRLDASTEITNAIWGPAYDGTNYYVGDESTSGIIYEYDNSGTYTGNNFDVTSFVGSDLRGVFLNQAGNLLIQGNGNFPFREYTTAGVYTGTNFSFPTAGTFYGAITIAGASYALSEDSNDRVTSVSAAYALGTAGDIISNTGGTPGGRFSIAFDGTLYYLCQINTDIVYVWAEDGGSGTTTIGDATARTDTNTGEPLFIRLK